jgi:molybdopterin-biosynthesis enzyme MoeA-like protein
VLCLPGVPEETQTVFAAAIGRLRGLLPLGVGARRDLESPTKDESALRPFLDRVSREHPGVWIKTSSAGFGRRKSNVVVSIESFAATRKEADALSMVPFAACSLSREAAAEELDMLPSAIVR